jgi:D-2-hydroxyacid dehydrogenase (NADP+)
MPSRSLHVLVGVPREVRGMLGDPNLRRLITAHPQVQVEFVDSPEEFAALAPGVDGAIVWPTFGLPPQALTEDAPLRWVQSMTAGVNTFLTPELVAAEQITITSTKGPMAPMMAEHAVLFMLALARNLPGFLQDQGERRWRTFVDERPMAQWYQKTIAILGVGAVGGNLARICKVGFGMRVLGMTRTRRDNLHVDRYVERSALHDALGEADVLALCLPITPATERIIDRAALAAIKPTAYLINVARGGLVDEQALIEALRAGRLAGAGLDTTAVEPLPGDSPLWAMPNVLITPHVAPARDRVNEYMADFWCENIRRFAEQQPLQGLVDRYAGY